MLILYVDESGPVATPHKGTVVLGGIIVDASLTSPVTRKVDAIVTENLGTELVDIEIHAQHMKAGKGRWRGIHAETRGSMLQELCALISDLHREHGSSFSSLAYVRDAMPVAAVPPHLPALEEVQPVQPLFEELLSRFQIHCRKNNHDGLVVMDTSRYARAVQTAANEWRFSGTRYGVLKRLVEVPLAVDSEMSRMIQLADVVAYAAYRAYESSDGDLLDLLLPSFEQELETGRLHGLAHRFERRPGGPNCECPACASREPVAVPVIYERQKPVWPPEQLGLFE